jgi:hypothetical protein
MKNRRFQYLHSLYPEIAGSPLAWALQDTPCDCEADYVKIIDTKTGIVYTGDNYADAGTFGRHLVNDVKTFVMGE